jgi:hypothetical protein
LEEEMISRVLKISSLVIVLAPSLLSGQDEDPVLAKLAELEKRMEALERAQTKEPVYSSSQEASAPSNEQVGKTVEVEELHRQLDILAEEVELLRSGEPERELTEQRRKSLGLSPSASKVYRKPRGVSIAGYGEMLYENFDQTDQSGSEADKVSRLDFLRAILYTGYRFNDRFLFNSEIEFEHSSTSKSGSASVEFAYLEYLINDNLSARGGLLLLPMGLVNEFHEPNVFLGAIRPQTEKRIIPTTWRENGAGIVGSYGPLNFRTYVVNGFDADGFSSDGFRGGRQKGSKAKAANMAIVARADLTPTPGVFFGGSVYRGGSAQGLQFGEQDLRGMTTIGEVHGQAQFKGWDLRGLIAYSYLDDATALNLALERPQDSPIAETMAGGYLQVGYNLLSRYHESMGLSPYYRFERLDTQRTVPQGFFADPTKDRNFHTFGIEFRPIYNIVIKSDYQWTRNALETGLNQFNIALGYSF